MNEPQPATLHCSVHPDRETLLRCNRCNRPMCSQCSVLTPTGYRCKECVSGQQRTFETTKTFDLPLAFVIALILGGIGAYISSFLGFFTIFVAPIVGTAIAEVIRWAVKKRRSTNLGIAADVGAGIGAMLPVGIMLLPVISGRGSLPLWPLIWGVVFVVLMISSLHYRLTGSELRRRS